MVPGGIHSGGLGTAGGAGSIRGASTIYSHPETRRSCASLPLWGGFRPGVVERDVNRRRPVHATTRAGEVRDRAKFRLPIR